MLLDNVIFRNCFVALSLGGLFLIWGQKPVVPNGQEPAAAEQSEFALKLSPSQQRGIANTSKLIDAALREQMKKVSKRVVNLLTVGPSKSQLESATIRAIAELFKQVKIQSISDLAQADELVGQWRDNAETPPKALATALSLGDLTIVQWLAPGAGGPQLHTWYVAKDKVLSQDVQPWGADGLPQVTVDKLHRVILSPELKADG